MDSEVIKLIASILTPIVVLVFGLILNRRIETIRISLAKEKEWKTKWGDTFYQTFRDLNTLVEDILCTLFEISELSKKNKGDSAEAKEKIAYLQNLMVKIVHIELSLRTQLGCAPKSANEVRNATTHLFELIKNAINSRKGNLDEMHSALIELNKRAMVAHSEIIGLNH